MKPLDDIKILSLEILNISFTNKTCSSNEPMCSMVAFEWTMSKELFSSIVFLASPMITFLIFLTHMEIIINSPGFYLHIQDAVVFIQYCIDGILNVASQFKI